MRQFLSSSRTHPTNSRSIPARALFAALLAVTISYTGSRTAEALPAYAARTGLPCGQCHISPLGGGPRTTFGRAFAANGHRLPGERPRHRWSDSKSGTPEDDYGPSMMGGYGSGMMGGYGHGMMNGYDH